MRHALFTAVLVASVSAAQAPSLDDVLARAAVYVDNLHKQLSGIVAEETYMQEVKAETQNSLLGTSRGGGLPQQTLRSDLLLVKPADEDRYVEFRDVFEVNGNPVRDRDERLTRLFLNPSAANRDRVSVIVRESARYNIGNIPRNINTPMLPLMFLSKPYQSRFRFKRADGGRPELSGATIATRGGSTPTFRVSTEMWVIEFRERTRNTIIRTNEGRDFPATGRFWIDPLGGAVLMSELVMDNGEVSAVINVSYQSEPLLGFNVPVEMRERYKARSDRVEGIASYGRFRQFGVQTTEEIKPPAKPPGR